MLWQDPSGVGALANGVHITLTRATGTFVGPGEPPYLAYLPQHLLCELQMSESRTAPTSTSSSVFDTHVHGSGCWAMAFLTQTSPCCCCHSTSGLSTPALLSLPPISHQHPLLLT